MSDTENTTDGARAAILEGRASLGIELGSTRIKACLVGPDPTQVLAVGSHEWENEFVDRRWTYSLESVESGLFRLKLTNAGGSALLSQLLSILITCRF